ncbi:hypothetical protein V8E36_003789 [Tilletia maclaganii]
MKTRDASVRKTPARFADSSDPISSSSEPARVSPPAREESGSENSGGDPSQRPARSGSPVSVLPPRGYVPPPQPSRAKKSKASAMTKTGSGAISEPNSSFAAAASPSATEVDPQPRAAKPPSPQSNESHQSDNDDDGDSSAADDQEAPTSAQRREAVARPKPQPYISIPETPSRRLQADRDTDFFLRRKVIRGAEKNPPPLSPVIYESEQSGSDEDFAPVATRKGKGKAAADSNNPKQPVKDTAIGADQEQVNEEPHGRKEHQSEAIEVSDSEEEVLELTSAEGTPARPVPPLLRTASRSISPIKQISPLKQQLLVPGRIAPLPKPGTTPMTPGIPARVTSGSSKSASASSSKASKPAKSSKASSKTSKSSSANSKSSAKTKKKSAISSSKAQPAKATTSSDETSASSAKGKRTASFVSRNQRRRSQKKA